MTKTNIIILIVLGIVIVGGITYAMNRSEPVDMPAAVENESNPELDVACEGALAYMTFPSGEAAEAFVLECKAGMHPEVLNPTGPEMMPE